MPLKRLAAATLALAVVATSLTGCAKPARDVELATMVERLVKASGTDQITELSWASGQVQGLMTLQVARNHAEYRLSWRDGKVQSDKVEKSDRRADQSIALSQLDIRDLSRKVEDYRTKECHDTVGARVEVVPPKKVVLTLKCVVDGTNDRVKAWFDGQEAPQPEPELTKLLDAGREIALRVDGFEKVTSVHYSGSDTFYHVSFYGPPSQVERLEGGTCYPVLTIHYGPGSFELTQMRCSTDPKRQPVPLRGLDFSRATQMAATLGRLVDKQNPATASLTPGEGWYLFVGGKHGDFDEQGNPKKTR